MEGFHVFLWAAVLSAHLATIWNSPWWLLSSIHIAIYVTSYKQDWTFIQATGSMATAYRRTLLVLPVLLLIADVLASTTPELQIFVAVVSFGALAFHRSWTLSHQPDWVRVEIQHRARLPSHAPLFK